MPQILGSSVSYRIAVGPQQGRKAFMIRTIRPLDRPDPGLARVAKANGFSLHAGVSCEGHQKSKRERLCRYIARPAVAVPRLSLSSTGKVVYSLKARGSRRAVADTLPGRYNSGSLRPGRPSVVDFIARLAALALRGPAKPRVKRSGTPSSATMGYWSCAARPNHRSRSLITPAKRGKDVNGISTTEVRSPAERHAAMTWAQARGNSDSSACLTSISRFVAAGAW